MTFGAAPFGDIPFGASPDPVTSFASLFDSAIFDGPGLFDQGGSLPVSAALSAFDEWLLRTTPRAVLVDLDFVYPSGGGAGSLFDGSIFDGAIFDASGSPAGIGTVGFSDFVYNTGPSDTPANFIYRSRIESMPEFLREIDKETLGGRSSVQIGDLVLNNEDHALDWMLSLIVDSQEVRFRLGDPSWSITLFQPICSAVVQKIESTKSGRIIVSLGDRGLLLDKGIVGALIAVGGNAGKPKPIVIGRPGYVEALVENEATLQYRACDATYWSGTNSSIVAAYDNGVTLGGKDALANQSATLTADHTTDQINVAGLLTRVLQVNDVVRLSTGGLPAVLPTPLIASQQYWVNTIGGSGASTWFTLSYTKGGATIDLTDDGNLSSGFVFLLWASYFDNFDGGFILSQAPAGVVTCDVSNPNMGFGANSLLASDAFSWAARVAGGLSSAQYLGAHGSYVTGTASDSEGLDPPIGWRTDSRANVADFLDLLAFSSNAAWGWTRDGKFTFIRIRPHSLTVPEAQVSPRAYNTPVYHITEDDLLSDVDCTQGVPRYKTTNVLYSKNYPALSFVAGGVLPGTSAIMRSEFSRQPVTASTSGSYSAAPWLYHKSMIESPELETMIGSSLETGASTAATTWGTFYRAKFFPLLEFLHFTARIRLFRIELGDLVGVYLPRTCGHTSEITFQVLGVGITLAGEKSVSLTLVRRRPADTSPAH